MLTFGNQSGESVQDIYAKLSDILQDVFDDDDLTATPELSATDVSGWDSLAHVRLMLSVERAFGVRFSATEVNSFKNVGDLAQAIATKKDK
jgi:acyl carrier protein